MSTANVLKLLEFGAQDAKLRAELELARACEAVVALGKKHGFDFTAEELLKALAHLRDLRAGAPLSDEDLAKVSGGASGVSHDLRKISQSDVPDNLLASLADAEIASRLNITKEVVRKRRQIARDKL